MKTNYNIMKIEELKAEEAKLRSELFNLTFQNKVGQLNDPSQIKKAKRNIAKVKTALRLKEIAGAKE